MADIPERMPLPVFATIRGAYGVILRNPKFFILSAIPSAVFIVAASLLYLEIFPPPPDRDPISGLTSALSDMLVSGPIYLVGFVPAAVAWHRFTAGLPKRPGVFGVSITLDELAYLGTGLLAFAIGAIPTAFLVLLWFFSGAVDGPEEGMSFAPIVIWLIIWCGLFMLHSFVFPAIALGRGVKLGEAKRFLGLNFFRLSAVLLASLVPGIAFVVVVSMSAPAVAPYWEAGLPLIIFVSLLAWTPVVATLSLAYAHSVQGAQGNLGRTAQETFAGSGERPILGGRDLPVAATAGAAYGHIVRNGVLYAKTGVPAILLLVLIAWAIDLLFPSVAEWIMAPHRAYLVIGVAFLVVFTPVATGWHRAIMDRDIPGRFLGMAVSGGEVRYFAYLLFSGAATALLLYVAVLAGFSLLSVIHLEGMVFLVFMLIALWVISRSMIYPALAIGRRISLAEARAFLGRNIWRHVGVVLLTAAPLYVVIALGVAGLFPRPDSFLLLVFMYSLIGVFIGAPIIAALSFSYRHCEQAANAADRL